MYGKLFDSMYDSTLAEDWRALVTFQQMIILCDADGMLDMTPQALSRRTSIPIEHIKSGISILELPDPYSRTPDQEGVRIELIDDHRPWGWHIVNHEKYKNLQDADTVRAQTKERVRKHRASKQDVTVGNGRKRHTDTDTDIKNISRFPDFWKNYPRKEGSKKKAETSFNNLTKKKQELAITDCLTRYLDTDKKYTPYPTTYINGELWEAETDQEEKTWR